MAKLNRLTNAEIYKVTKWAEEHALKLQEKSRKEAAAEATEAMGFQVSIGNMVTIAETLGLQLRVKQPTKKPGEEQDKAIAELREELASAEHRIKQLEWAVFGIQADVTNIPTIELTPLTNTIGQGARQEEIEVG